MVTIGLTGGIGSGKTEASKYLFLHGAHILDADKISREMVYTGSETLKEIVQFFGEDILHQEGSLDRKKLGNIVFSDEKSLKQLNAIMHKRIISEVKDQLEQLNKLNSKQIVVVDAPLLIETGLNSLVDQVWVVDIPEDIQIQRIKKRDHLFESEIKKRIKSQLPRKERIQYADVILDNSGEINDLYKQIDKALLGLNAKITD